MERNRGKIRVCELFAGVGGFRLALEGYRVKESSELDMPSAGPYVTVWANQWEPSKPLPKQFAWHCYEQRFGNGSCCNEDINKIVQKIKNGGYEIPDFDMLVAGFPCQDYSVAKPLGLAKGISGEKGRLWWTICDVLEAKKPKYILLENVDRLLRGKAANCGRDFSMILSSLFNLGYSVEWRIINAAEYGFPQKRRRVFIFGVKTNRKWNLERRIYETGVIARAFPVEGKGTQVESFSISCDSDETANMSIFNRKTSPFQNAGAMQEGKVLTMKVLPPPKEEGKCLRDVLVSDEEVPEEYFISEAEQTNWAAYREAKKEPRVDENGFEYLYAEGAMPWPDPIDRPARTILTGEGGRGASRMKHAVKGSSGRIRRLVPDELEQLQGFPRGWTNTGMTDIQRAFCMGNALVVQIPHAIGKVISERRAKGQF